MRPNQKMANLTRCARLIGIPRRHCLHGPPGPAFSSARSALLKLSAGSGDTCTASVVPFRSGSKSRTARLVAEIAAELEAEADAKAKPERGPVTYPAKAQREALLAPKAVASSPLWVGRENVILVRHDCVAGEPALGVVLLRRR